MSKNNNTVLVSAFMTNINNTSYRSTENYIEYGNYLINSKGSAGYKVIFIERDIFKKYFNDDRLDDDNEAIMYYEYENKKFNYILSSNNNIIFVFFEKKDNYLYNYNDRVTQFCVNTDNPNKDTIEYMFVQCHKTEWVKMAIILFSSADFKKKNNSNCPHFIWIDFGIYHMINDAYLFNKAIEKIYQEDENNLNNKIRIASCINPNNIVYHKNIYQVIAWYFAGSVFGGSSEILLQFADLMKEKCINIIHERNHLMWEVNVWYLIFVNNKELFDCYECNHDLSILSKYSF